jgi:hypothetical protein
VLSSVVITGRHLRRTAPYLHRGEKPLIASHLEATLTTMLISVDCKELTDILSPLDATLTKKRGWGSHHPSRNLFPRSIPSALSPILRTLFQVPYPVTFLFATLTKTAGVGINSSQFGTLSCHLQRFFPGELPSKTDIPHE